MRFPLALAPLALSACATVGGMRAAPVTEGASWGFSAPVELVRAAACESLRSYGMYLLDVGSPADSIWTVLAQKTSLWSYGEYVRVTVLPTDAAGMTATYILTKRLLATNFTASDDWSGRLIPRMEEMLRGRREVRAVPCEVTVARAANRD